MTLIRQNDRLLDEFIDPDSQGELLEAGINVRIHFRLAQTLIFD